MPYGCIKKAHNDNLGMEVSFQSRELSSHISATGKKQESKLKLTRGYKLLKPTHSDAFLSARLHFLRSLNASKQHHQVGTDCSNIRVYGDNFSFKPLQPEIVLTLTTSGKTPVCLVSFISCMNLPPSSTTQLSGQGYITLPTVLTQKYYIWFKLPLSQSLQVEMSLQFMKL